MATTIYVAPGESQCRVYAIPYAMRPGQAPRDISPQYRKDWLEIALLRPNYREQRLEVVYIYPPYRIYRDDIANAGAGEFWTVEE